MSTAVSSQKPFSGAAPWARGVEAERWATPAAVAIVLLHGMLAWIARAAGITTGNDQAAYVLLARAIRHWSYSDFYLVGSPAHMGYPPVFPTLLAMLSLFGERLDLFYFAIAVCSMATLALVYDSVRRLSGAGPALIVLTLCALNPELLRFGGELMSETPYMLFTALCVWAVVRERDTSPEASTRWAALAMAAAICAALTRTVGVTLVGALIILWLLERRYRRAIVLAVAGALTIGGWVLYTVLEPVKYAGGSYLADATFARQERQSFAAVLFERVTTNVPTYLTAKLPYIVPVPTVAGTAIDNILSVLVITALLGVGAWVLWRRARIVVLYLAAYGALLAVWPWRVTRFLVPLIPFILWTMFSGAFDVATRRSWLRWVPAIVGAIILATAISRDVALIRSAWQCDRRTAETSPACYDDVQRGFFAAARFVRQFTPDTAIVLTIKEATFAHLTGRTASRYVFAGPDSTGLRHYLHTSSTDFILLSPLRISRAQRVPLLRQICRDLEVVRQFPRATLLLRVTPPGSTPPGENACAALQQYERDSAGYVESVDT